MFTSIINESLGTKELNAIKYNQTVTDYEYEIVINLKHTRYTHLSATQ